MIIKCKECGTKLDIDEADYECGVPSSTICPLCGEEVLFTISKSTPPQQKKKVSHSSNNKMEEKVEEVPQPTKETSRDELEPVSKQIARETSKIENDVASLVANSKKNRMLIFVLLGVVVVLAVGLIFVLKNNSTNTDDMLPNAELEEEKEDDMLDDSDMSQQGAVTYYNKYDFVCERYVREDDLIGLSKEELRIMRNWIFARHGYIFKSEDLQEYFGRFSWYYPRYTDVTNMLSDIEITNIDFIKRYE